MMLVTRSKPHAGVHVLRGQRREGAVGIRVELDEDVVPDLDAAGIAFVDKAAVRAVAGGREVHVDLGAGPHGPVSPIIQKLSFLLPGTMWVFGSQPAVVNFLAQYIAASWSAISKGDASGFAAMKVGEVIVRAMTCSSSTAHFFFPTGFAEIRAKHGGVEPLRWKLPDFDHQLPCPVNGFLLE